MRSEFRQRTLATFLALVGATSALWASPQSVVPSFDCSRASGEIEQLICDDEGLAALDVEMAEIYRRALERWPEEILPEERAFQRGWIKGRNDCWKDEDARACVETSYRTRMVELQIQSGQLEVPSPVGYVCQGEERHPFMVVFFSETDPPSAVITFADAQVIAFGAPTASGAKYAAPGVEFWEHHGEATVDWYGSELRCRVR